MLHGTYSFARTLVAYRNDYCLTCNRERTAYQIRTFDILHLFWLPILPLGFWKRWRCGTCGADPHASPRTRRSFKWAGVVVLFLTGLLGWAVPVREFPEDSLFFWVLRIGGPVGGLWALWATLRTPSDVDLKGMLRAVQPITDVDCPICKIPLFPSEPAWRCTRCGIKRRALGAA